MLKKLRNKKKKNRNFNIYDEEENLQNSINKYKKNKKYNSCSSPKITIFIIIIIIIIFSIYYIFKVYNNNNKYDEKEEIIKSYQIIKEYTREKLLKEGRNYLDKCLEGELSNKTKLKKYKNPKITAIIPVYNSQQAIKSVIRSIQNQKMEEIEIILINDFSTDNSSKIIEEMQKEDPRIKIINNKKNMGILYSRCIGVLKGEGKYIINLNNNDFFLDNYIFDLTYFEAENGNFDIISFIPVLIKKYHADITEMSDGGLQNYTDNFTVYQPELSYFSFFKDGHFKFVDIQIWGKLFRNETYKAAVNLLGQERYSTYNIINEDLIGLYAICNVARSYKFVKLYGLFHLINNPSVTTTKVSYEHRMEMIIFFTDILFDLSKNENKNYAAIRIIDLFDELIYLGEKNKKYLEKILKKIVTSKYIQEKYKAEIREKYKVFSF